MSSCSSNWSEGSEAKLVCALEVVNQLSLLDVRIEFNLVHHWWHLSIVH